MLWTASGLTDYSVIATDGHLGTVSDFLFDDHTWQIRWLVVDTGHWLPGRKVLLPPAVLGHPNPAQHEFAVRLTKQQIKDSPDILSDRPVSRQEETNIYGYYGWRPYWDNSFFMGGYGYVGDDWIGATADQREREIARSRLNDGDPHLRSVAEVIGYHIHATDGEIGHVQNFLIEDTDWAIRFLVADTKNWWPGQHVLISPASAATIDWTQGLMNLTVDRQVVKDSPVYDAATTVDQAYERRLNSYYSDIGMAGRL